MVFYGISIFKLILIKHVNNLYTWDASLQHDMGNVVGNYWKTNLGGRYTLLYARPFAKRTVNGVF